jgi:hypothetical protein
MSDEQRLRFLVTIPHIHRLGNVDRATRAVYFSLTTSSTMREELSDADGWQQLIPMATSLVENPPCLELLFGQPPANLSQTLTFAADVHGVLSVHMPFALMWAWSKATPTKEQSFLASMRLVQGLQLRTGGARVTYGSWMSMKDSVYKMTDQTTRAYTLDAMVTGVAVHVHAKPSVYPALADAESPMPSWTLQGRPDIANQAVLRAYVYQPVFKQTSSEWWTSSELVWDAGDRQLTFSCRQRTHGPLARERLELEYNGRLTRAGKVVSGVIDIDSYAVSSLAVPLNEGMKLDPTPFRYNTRLCGWMHAGCTVAAADVKAKFPDGMYLVLLVQIARWW